MMILQQTRGALSSGDQLALDLPFAETKSLTARLGPTPTFTRASSGTFVGSNGLIQSAGNNVARFDHNPITLASRGLLIEDSRRNLFVRSENFGIGWLSFDATILNDSTTSPDGTNSADKLVVNSGLALGRVSQTFALTGAHIMSVFAKAGEWSWVFLAPLGPGNGVWFNLSNGQVGTQSSGFVGAMTSFGNGWWRCSVSFTGSGVSTTARIVSTNGNGIASTGDGTSGIFIWGAQLEAGSFATSYIQTTTSSVVRSADVCSISGANFTNLWNGVDATILFIGSRNATQVGQINWGVSSGTFGTNIQSDRTATAERISAAGTGILNASGVSPLTTYKIATALKTGDYALSLNGGSAVTSSNSFALSLSRMDIGCSYASSAQLNGCISNLRLFKKRLANAKLQAITV